MMSYQLTLSSILQRAETLFGYKQIVSRLPDKTTHRYSYADMARRAKQLALALHRLGIRSGDRVATLAWNHHQHLETYFGIPLTGGVLHTLNLRLPAEDLIYIVNHAEDRVLLVDQELLPLAERIRTSSSLEHVVVFAQDRDVPNGALSYEQFLAGNDAESFQYTDIAETQAAAMCYTSGTTGRPKGVLYSHRALVLHSMAEAMVDSVAVCESDVVLPVVPMFHANAWGLPYSATMVGAEQVLPGPFLDAPSLLELCQQERVTVTAGVPTIWLGLLQLLDKNPGAYDLSSLRALIVGGQAVPKSMIRGFEERHGLQVIQAWGMTEMSPLGTISIPRTSVRKLPLEAQYDYRAMQGTPSAIVEIRARGDEGLVPWDGKTMGELEVRGPCVVASYYSNPDAGTSFTEDGWLRTGDIVTIDALGYIQIQDRAKDLVKSGGEWISTVAIENALMGHPAVAEAASIAVAHPKWLERPLAVVVLKEGATTTEDELRDFLGDQLPRWWLPDRIEFVNEIPKTATGKFHKLVLRERYREELANADEAGVSTP
jgi:fatty-acyl-CoA synthase